MHKRKKKVNMMHLVKFSVESATVITIKTSQYQLSQLRLHSINHAAKYAYRK